tara:strand:+ start:1576 stop:2040 length:465 start_codon:yes stop_codon:yes gene_type:complete
MIKVLNSIVLLILLVGCSTYSDNEEIDETSSSVSNSDYSSSDYSESDSPSFDINVTASSSANYTLTGTDRNGDVSGNDPDLTFKVGDTINFDVSATGHPFYLKTASRTGTSDTISGVSNNGAESGKITWQPSETGTFYYICSLHGGMVGTIIIE